MSNDIINFIQKQGNLFSAAKYFDGISNLKKISKNSPEVLNLIEKESRGYLEFESDNKKKYYFDFYVENAILDDHHVQEHLYIFIDLIVPQKNFETEIADWVSSYMEDMRPDYILNSKSLSKHQFVFGEVIRVNGKKYDYYSDTEIIRDDDVEDIVKSNLVKESLENIQKLFD